MYKKTEHIHFVGVSGIGMSGIAKVLAQQGYCVSGCDAAPDKKIVQELINVGCHVYTGNDSPQCNDPSINVVVYSTGIENQELARARERGIPVVHRSKMLAFLMQQKTSIAITGSHGKTTTSSMIAHILLDADFDPTFLLGGILETTQSNGRAGNSQFLVAEADESDRSLLNLFPTIAVLTNIDFDHAETYSDLADITQTFKAFLERVPFYGKAIVWGQDPYICALLAELKQTVMTYGTNAGVDWRIINKVTNPTNSQFSIEHKGVTYGPINLAMPGDHNVLNATAAFATAFEVGVPPQAIIKGLGNFPGVDRRFTFKGLCNGARLIDDYGHHPTEIKNVLTIARGQTKEKVRVLFQPHRYTRTHKLWNEFIQMFCQAGIDELVITDIFSAGERPIEGVTSQRLVQALKTAGVSYPVFYLPLDPHFATLTAHFKDSLQPDQILILQGAGKVNTLAAHLIEPK